MEFSGCIPSKVILMSGDKLVLYPVYLCPVEILERGVMSRPSYVRNTVMVNAFNRRTRLLDAGDVELSASCDLSAFDVTRLEVKVSHGFAAELAIAGAAPEDSRSWRRMIRSRKVAVITEKIRLAWHIYAIRGGEAIDTFTGEAASAAGLADTLFS